MYKFEDSDDLDYFGFKIDSDTGTVSVGTNGIHTNTRMNYDGQGVQRFPVS